MKKHYINFIVSAAVMLTALGVYFIGHNELLGFILGGCAFVELGLAFLPRRGN